jgi:hypothetical protein
MGLSGLLCVHFFTYIHTLGGVKTSFHVSLYSEEIASYVVSGWIADGQGTLGPEFLKLSLPATISWQHLLFPSLYLHISLHHGSP